MAKKTKIEPVLDATRNRWRIDVPASIAKDGKRFKAWFKTRDAARDHLSDLSNESAPASAIPPILAMKADEARAILEPWNRDLVQADRELADALEALGDAGTILEAAKAYRVTHEARHSSKPLGEAVALIFDSKIDLRDATMKSYRYSLEKILVTLHSMNMADIATGSFLPRDWQPWNRCPT